MFASPLNEILWLVPTLLFFVLVLVLVDHCARGLRDLLTRLREARQPAGRSPLRPLPVASFEETRTGGAPCPCGGELRRVFEGPAPSPPRQLWLVIEACPRCHRRIPTYFDVTGVAGQGPAVAGPLTPVPR